MRPICRMVALPQLIRRKSLHGEPPLIPFVAIDGPVKEHRAEVERRIADLQ